MYQLLELYGNKICENVDGSSRDSCETLLKVSDSYSCHTFNAKRDYFIIVLINTIII